LWGRNQIMDLDHRVVVITGSSSGVGKTTALSLNTIRIESENSIEFGGGLWQLKILKE